MVPVDELEGYKPRRPRRLIVVIAVLLSAGLVGYLVLSPAPDEAPGVPEFSLPMLTEDRVITSAELRGRPVVLNFWASWCVPCREEMPLFQEISDEFSDSELVVLAVDVRDLESDARRFIDDLRLTFPIARDPGNRLAETLGVVGLPQTFFITEEWTFLAVERGSQVDSLGPNQVLGAIDEDTLRRRVAQLLDDGS